MKVDKRQTVRTVNRDGFKALKIFFWLFVIGGLCWGVVWVGSYFGWIE